MYLELHSLGAESANLIKLLPVPWFDNKVEFGIAHRDPRGAACGGQVVERGTRPRPTVVKWAECARRGRCQGVHGPETPGTSRSVDSGSFHMGRAGLTFGPSGGGTGEVGDAWHEPLASLGRTSLGHHAPLSKRPPRSAPG